MKRKIKKILRKYLSRRTLSDLSFDFNRAKARLIGKKLIKTECTRLHAGCGDRRVDGFLNVDITNAEEVVDLASPTLPFSDRQFEAIVSQHVIEHLDMTEELEPLLREFYRISKPGCRIYLSTPDMAKIVSYYQLGKCQDLLNDRKTRWRYSYESYPASQIINHLFHQDGQHKNLFDLKLLAHLLSKAGFVKIREIDEPTLLSDNPSFSPRNDSFMSLYVYAEKP